MATSTNVDVIISAKDHATKVINDVGNSIRNAGESMASTFKEGGITATAFLGSLTALGVAATKVASDFEQNRISFETMLGSASKGRKVLSDLSDFAVKTPFELKGLLQASKSLLAYGTSAEDLIPTLRNLGDISSGVGMDKLPNLILAFGQVKAATKLTGMELRQFTETGVPMLQLLVDQANKAGGSWVTVGGAAKKTKVDVGELNNKLAIASQRLKEAEGNAKTKQSTLMSLRNTVQNYTNKINEASTAGTKASKVWVENKVTVEQMKEMITDGAVSFDMVKQALLSTSKEGGKFFNLMEKQSKTFGGTMSNIKDQVTRTLAEIAGIDIAAGGLIREGSLFAMLKQGAESALAAMNKFTPVLVSFTQNLLKNKDAMMIIVGALGGALVLAIGAFVVTFGQGIAILTAFMVIGAGIMYVVDELGKSFGGWGIIIETIRNSFLFFANLLITIFSPAIETLKQGFITALPEITKLGEALSPLLTTILTVLGQALMAVLTIFLSLMAGMITAVGYALPFIIGLLTGFANFINGIMQIIVGIFTNNWNLVWEGTKKTFQGIWEVISNFLNIIMIGIAGFIFGIIRFFQTLYDALIGKSIIPDLVNGVMLWFETMKTKVINSVMNLVNGVIKFFEDMKSKVDGVISFIRNLIDDFKPRISIGLDLPDIGKAWNDLKGKARSIGVPGFQTGGIVPGAIGAPVPILAHGGEKVIPAGLSGSGGGGGGGSTFNVYIGMYAGSQTEKRNIAKELYGALLQVAQSQNKNVQSYMGG